MSYLILKLTGAPTLGKNIDKRPETPDSLPKYLNERLPEQNSKMLREVQQWIDELFEYRDRPLDEKELVNSDEQVEDVEETSKGTVKESPCGKVNCSSCPHGPYCEGDTVKPDYSGKAE